MRIRVLLKLLFPGICCLVLAAALGADHDGDVNIDGDVNVVDLLWGQQALQGTRSLLPEQEAHGDVAPLVSGVPQPDGVFNLGDVLVTQRIVLGALAFSVPGNQFNIGDSIGEGESADDTIGQPHHETVWSTGYNGGDSVNSFNERFEGIAAADYYENNASRDALFNHAVSGAEMADFALQAQGIVAASAQTPSGNAEMVAVFLGNNADGFLMTPQGARYQDLKTGTGESAEPGDVVTMHFVGWLDNDGRKGKELYNTRRDGKPISFVVGTDKVMQGWSDGVIGMKPGGKRRLLLPPALGYGSRGAEDVIPPGAGLMFLIDLIAVEK